CGRYPTVSVAGVRTTVPASGCWRPARMRSSVVLPIPFGPTTPIRLPGVTASETRSRTRIGPCRFVMVCAASVPCIEPPDRGTGAGRNPRVREGIAGRSVGAHRTERSSAAIVARVEPFPTVPFHAQEAAQLHLSQPVESAEPVQQTWYCLIAV